MLRCNIVTISSTSVRSRQCISIQPSTTRRRWATPSLHLQGDGDHGQHGGHPDELVQRVQAARGAPCGGHQDPAGHGLNSEQWAVAGRGRTRGCCWGPCVPGWAAWTGRWRAQWERCAATRRHVCSASSPPCRGGRTPWRGAGSCGGPGSTPPWRRDAASGGWTCWTRPLTSNLR